MSKKIIFIMIMILSFSLISTSCNKNEEPTKENKVSKNEEIEKEIKNDKELIKILEEECISEGDQILNAKIENGKISISIKINIPEPTLEKDYTITSYSTISDQLLNYSNWDILSINFENIGEITMNRKSSVENEYGGKYFPSIEIENNLKK